MSRPLEPGDIAEVTLPTGRQLHPVRMFDGDNIYISAHHNETTGELSLLVIDDGGNYHVQGLSTGHTVQFTAAVPQVLLTGSKPVDIQILLHLSDADLKELCVSNRSVATLCREDDLWRGKLVKKYGGRILASKPGTQSFREYYRILSKGAVVSAGAVYSLILMRGRVYSCGANYKGQLGSGNRTRRNAPTPISGVPEINSISAGFEHALLLGMGGQVYAMGNGSSGELGLDGTDKISPSLITGIPAMKSVSAGKYYSLFLTADGRVYGCGRASSGQLGLGYPPKEYVRTPTLIPNLRDIRRISAGEGHSLFLDVNGRVYATGDNNFGECGLGGNEPRRVLEPIASNAWLPPIQDIVACQNYSIFLDAEGKVHGCGANSYGQLGWGDSVSYVPRVISGLPKIKSIASSGRHSLFLSVEGLVYVCGSGDVGQLGLGPEVSRAQFVTLIPNLPKIQGISAGYDHTLLVDVNNQVYACGSSGDGQLGLGNFRNQYVPEALVPL